jgi:type I restriction enzyme S subunit
VFLDMFGDPINNPRRWEMIKLKELGDWKSGGTPPRSKEDYFQGNIPWYSSGELGNMYISDSFEYITEAAINENSAKLVQPGSLLLGMYDTAALKSSITTIYCSCNQAIAFSKIDNEKANIAYVYCAIQLGRDFFRRQQRGVRQKNLNLSMVEEIRIPNPPINLQNRFSSILERINEFKVKITNSSLEINDLFDILMQKAFMGELVA